MNLLKLLSFTRRKTSRVFSKVSIAGPGRYLCIIRSGDGLLIKRLMLQRGTEASEVLRCDQRARHSFMSLLKLLKMT